ncbi:coiled-coil domain-containing protein 136 isoform X1 [Oryzias latipes]|uniref:Coiled-coil domain containing 136b n=1 Tax=Oryzias latipes TaxID=8090 RepID=A0A3B3I2W8_ORYLA|nr:coiled-coil domain-containing protein 136 isoform X1 [Oryzias latipes]XP_023807959.1 coiled-coil domain-containing protein 136 isoform X1 [Oryzias latipes]
MDGLRLPPLIEEVLDPSDELQDDTLIMGVRDPSCQHTEDEGHVKKRQHEKEAEGKGAALKSKEELKELRAQLVQLLLRLEETQEVSQKHEQGCEELQGLLEDERLASAHQAESFTRHIQTLQVQFRSAQDEVNRLQEEREGELKEVQQELRLAQEEVLVLQQAAEEAAADSESDIAYLQEELCRLKAELQALHATVAKYELEINSLRAELNTETLNPCSKVEAARLQEEVWSLTCERQTLSGDNRHLSNRVERLQQQGDVCDEVYLAIKEKLTTEPHPHRKADPCAPPSQAGPEQLDSAAVQGDNSRSEISSLKVQLRWAEETAQKVQKECDTVKTELVELQVLYDSSQRERTSLALELQRCKAELQKLLLRSPQDCTPQSEPPLLSTPIIGLIVIVALIWCWWEELSS